MNQIEDAKKSLMLAISIGPDCDLEMIKNALKELQEVKESEKIAQAHGLEVSRVQEGIEVRDMLKKMPKKVEVGSKWIVLPMSWVKKWQEYIYFDYVLGTPSGNDTEGLEMPGQIDFKEIVKPMKMMLADQTKEFKW